jgi:hypothetical protein
VGPQAAVVQCSTGWTSTGSCSRSLHHIPLLRHQPLKTHPHIITITWCILRVALIQSPSSAITTFLSCIVLLPQTFAPAEAAPVAEPLTPQQARKEYKPLTPEDLAQYPIDPEQLKLPAGFHWYETMIVLRAMMDDQGR